MGIFIVLMLLQLLFYFGIFVALNSKLPYFYSATMVYSVVVVLYLLSTPADATAKLTWAIIILLFPVFGSFLYWFVLSDVGHRTIKKRYCQIEGESSGLLKDDGADVCADDEGLIRYLSGMGGFPVYKDTQVTYFPVGEDKFNEMLVQLEQAREYIFMEYFIVEEGMMWGRILEILARKAKEGVDVRIMYDGMCEFVLLPHTYPKKLAELGIKCKVFSPAAPVLSTHYNFRDHRKILVIDGHTAFNGGVNLADEYVNHVEKFGHWKDTAVMLKGPAVRSFTLMFLQMWNMSEEERIYEPYLKSDFASDTANTGYVIPYGDAPLTEKKIGEHVYIDMLYRAKKYIHIMSPYLILDGELENALIYAAQRGVDVEIIMPGIPDKLIAYAIAKTYYASLLAGGVKIYEYVPGFVHAKVCVSDDAEAVVGTINFDYRSLYHHFECATYMKNVACISDIAEDFEKTKEKCRVVTKQTIWEGHRLLRPIGFVFKTLAPLM